MDHNIYLIPEISTRECSQIELDIIEEIISEEIVDETDQYEDNQSKKRARRVKNAAVMRGCVSPGLLSTLSDLRFFVIGLLNTAQVGVDLIILASVAHLSAAPMQQTELPSFLAQGP